ARFVLSGQTVFSSGSKETPNRFPLRSFYNNLTTTLRKMDENELEELLCWWDDKVFGANDDSYGEDDDSDVGPEGPSVFEQMKEQAKAKQKN
ncbi:hypothetical protein H0H81_010685, partial [Sphagnurus paluster]